MSASQIGSDREGSFQLGLYRFLNRLGWPKSYLGRLLLICVVALSVPLFVSLGLVVFASNSIQVDWFSVFAAVIGGNLTGIGFMLVGLRLAMEPVRLSVAALDGYRRNRRLPELPGHFDDEPGRLMREIHYTIMSAETVHADLLRRAETDPLTEVANRRRFLRRGTEELAAARRTGETLSLVILDIDRFKVINDTFGHPAGDAVLRLVAELLTRALRGRDSLARIGGEEFAILLPDTPLAEAVVIAERLRHKITTLPMPALDGATVTASFGVTDADRDETDVETITHRADKALYDAKRSGRDCVAYRSTDDRGENEGAVSARMPFTAIAARSATKEAVWLID